MMAVGLSWEMGVTSKGQFRLDTFSFRDWLRRLLVSQDSLEIHLTVARLTRKALPFRNSRKSKDGEAE